VHVTIIWIKLDNVLSKHGCEKDVFYDYNLKLNLLNYTVIRKSIL